jgi:hypothetical protein
MTDDNKPSWLSPKAVREARHDRHAVKLGLRKLYDDYPEAFEFYVQGLQTFKEDWPEHILPPPFLVRGKGKIPDWVLAELLTKYRTRPDGETRPAFAERIAGEGFKFDDDYVYGEWSNDHTVTAHLKDAQTRAKADPDFASTVERCIAWAVDNHPPGWAFFQFIYGHAQRGFYIFRVPGGWDLSPAREVGRPVGVASPKD